MHGQTLKPPSGEATTIVADVEEVTLDLVVRDKKNKSVLDLKPDDLTIADNGDRVKLTNLRLSTAASSGDHLITMVFDRLDSAAARNAHDIATKVFKVGQTVQ